MFIGRWLRTALAAATLLCASATASAAQAPDGLTVLAAASLTDVLQDIGKSYEAVTHGKVKISFAGSMLLARQIEASSGADVFISADSESMDYLDAKGLIEKPTRRNLLSNSLVLVAPADSKLRLAISLGFKLAAALGGGRLALANPQSVPAGRYGEAALKTLGVWDSVAGSLAEGEDARATLAYVARGEVPLGIVYATDARIEPRVRVVATFPANTHPTILYPAAATKGAKPDAARFLAFLRSESSRATFAKAGFTVLPAK